MELLGFIFELVLLLTNQVRPAHSKNTAVAVASSVELGSRLSKFTVSHCWNSKISQSEKAMKKNWNWRPRVVHHEVIISCRVPGKIAKSNNVYRVIWKTFFPSFQFCHVAYRPINSGAVQLDSKNIDSTLGNFQLKILRFKILTFFFPSYFQLIMNSFSSTFTRIGVGLATC